jgi:hypothetical protein
MAAITDLTTLAHTDLAVGDWLVVHDLSAATDKKMAPFASDVWTPDLTFGGSSTGITYSSRSGVYLLVGKLVFVHGVLILTSKGTATGNASIGNLPVTSASSQSSWLTLVWQNMTSSYVNMIGFVTSSSTSISVRGITAAATTNITNVTDAGFANNTTLYIHGVYRSA